MEKLANNFSSNKKHKMENKMERELPTCNSFMNCIANIFILRSDSQLHGNLFCSIDP